MQKHTPQPGLSEGNHKDKAFREPREKQNREFWRTDRWVNRRILWWVAVIILVLFFRAVFIFLSSLITTKKNAAPYKESCKKF